MNERNLRSCGSNFRAFFANIGNCGCTVRSAKVAQKDQQDGSLLAQGRERGSALSFVLGQGLGNCWI
jgi:hypothetical protein